MSTYRLDRLFAAQSVALAGASPRAKSLGGIVLRQLLSGAFSGKIFVVNPKYSEIAGQRTYRKMDELPEPPDVVVVTAPPNEVPQILDEAGAKGAAVAVVITAGLGHGAGSLAERARVKARRHGLRIVGPNGLGVIAPRIRLNASFASSMPPAGNLAVLSQSGAIAAGLAEWASQRRIGFSAVVSLGDAVDVDFGDLLDFFAVDPHTRAILLYIESVADARKFMSAARVAARVKPVIAIKSGRHAQGARAAATHTGALAGSDAVYEAALRRAGILRVLDLPEMFAAAETLARLAPFSGRRLAVLTNGGGLGVLAVDRLMDLGGSLAEMSPDTMAKLDAILPAGWSKGNPVDIIGDADPERYIRALSTLIEDPQNDAVLVLNVPTALASATSAASAVAKSMIELRSRSSRPKPVLAAWIAGDAEAAAALDAAALPTYENEVEAVRGFMHLVHYREAIEALMETPPSLPNDFRPDVSSARAVVAAAIEQQRRWLDPMEVTAVLSAYGIPIIPVWFAADPDSAADAAQSVLAQGGGVVVKILSPDIVHKSEVGGVALNLTSPGAVREAAREMLARARREVPDARITGVTLNPMIVRPKARELIIGIADDPTFGPIVAFGRGGTAVEVINDKSLALPPLDLKLAHDLIARTRVARILRAYRDVPAADLHAVALVLVKIAQLVADVPEIRELDLNPLLADKDGVITVDARISVMALASGARGHSRFAIRPYPSEWERHVETREGLPAFVRPVRPEDEVLLRDFLAEISSNDLRLRFFAPVRHFSHAFLARLTQLDYARSVAFVAIEEAGGRALGVVRLHTDANHENAEFAILVRSDLKGRGLGWLLMQLIIEYARREGLRTIEGQVLRENTTMIGMCEQLGFSIVSDPADREVCIATLSLA
ncbi:MAG: acetyltransferase [Variibacter sp.]|nr:acetyltransferase [Variibacter sp.]